MNVLKPDKKSTIITLLKNGISQREISRKTSIDRKTVTFSWKQRFIFKIPH
jgi:hypothetical protein